MPIVSKYSSAQQQQLLDDVMAVLQQQQITPDLALMTLGNAVTHVIAKHYSAASQPQVAEQFGKVLLQSLQAAN